MLNSPKKSASVKPLKTTSSYANSDQYFVRIAQWRWLDTNNISITDPRSPGMLTLEPWTQLVFLAADGSKTISEYIDFVEKLYAGGVPDNLENTIITEIETLLKYGIIKLSATSIQPELIFDKAS